MFVIHDNIGAKLLVFDQEFLFETEMDMNMSLLER